MSSRTTTAIRDWLAHDFRGVPGWGLILGVLVIVGAVGVGMTASGGAAPPTEPTTQASATPTAEPEPSDEPLGPTPVVLFIGDSYTAGVGASRPATRWTTLVATDLGWAEANYGRGGTGYLTGAGRDGCGRAYCPDYRGSIAEAIGDGVAPDVVVISGGQNDTGAWGETPEWVTEAITATYRVADQAFPDADIVAIGPSWIGATEDWQVAFDQAVRDGAAAVGATYVSLLDPQVLDDPEFALEDGAHVNDAGHAAIAARVIEQLG